MSSIRAARSRLPGEFVAELYRAFPVNLAERILMGMARRRRVTLRVNTIKASAVEVMEEFRSEGVKYQRVQWYPDAFVITNKSERDLGSLPSYREGRIYLQSLSSMVPPLVLAPRAGDEVLDIAAAPGSKATQMAALMENRGRIVAVDVDRLRAQRLAFNVERQGARIVEVVAGDGVAVAASSTESFDRVLVDAPCSGEGLFLVDEPATYRPWSHRLRSRSTASQRRLLDAGVKALKPGGTLVYSTCTLNPEENELAVDDLVKRHAGQLEAVPIEFGMPDWSPALEQVEGRVLSPSVKHARRILPSATMEGFFVALLRKTG